MTKKQLYDQVMLRMDSRSVIDAVLDVIYDALVGGEDVAIRDFGFFRVRNMKQTRRMKPGSSESIIVPNAKTVRFRMSEKMKRDLNRVKYEHTVNETHKLQGRV